MKYENVNVSNYCDILDVVYDVNDNIAYDVAMEKGVADLDLDEFLDEYASNCVEEFKAKREAGVTLDTVHGPVHGHFVGAVEYAVAGDPYNGYETEYGMAFAADNGQIVMAYKMNNGLWRIFDLKDLGGVIHWDIYPKDWDVVLTRPESIKTPV